MSNGFPIITEIVRRRVFADLSVANLLRFHDGVAAAEVTPAGLLRHLPGYPDPDVCKEERHAAP